MFLLFRLAKMLVATVTTTQMQTYMEEQLQKNGFTVTINEQSADALVATVVFPVDFGKLAQMGVMFKTLHLHNTLAVPYATCLILLS